MVTREQLLELDKKRKLIEEEINALTEYLEKPGMPGVHGKLTDNEGFPLAGLDLMEIRKARNRLAIIQNDYKAIMNTIEQKMQVFFEQQSSEKKNESEESKRTTNNDTKEPLTVSVPEETKTCEKNKTYVPFAYIASVMDNSPADEAGLRTGDGLLRFDVVEIGKYSDPLIKVSEIVRAKKDSEIELEVVRKNEEGNKLEFKKLRLIPHIWSGQGLLGCRLTLENKN